MNAGLMIILSFHRQIQWLAPWQQADCCVKFWNKNKKKPTAVSKDMADGALGEQQGPRSKEPWREMIGSPVPLFPPLCHPTPALQLGCWNRRTRRWRKSGTSPPEKIPSGQPGRMQGQLLLSLLLPTPLPVPPDHQGIDQVLAGVSFLMHVWKEDSSIQTVQMWYSPALLLL